jgi:MFS family permease
MSPFRKRRTDADDPPSWPARFGLLAFAVLQNGLLGGIIFGWASIDSTMLVASIDKGGAGVNPEKTSHVFSWASSVAMLSSFFLGCVLDTCGPRVCSIVSCLSIAIGSALLAAQTNFTQFSVGACFTAFGGPGICTSIIHIANLFPSFRNLIMSLLSGSIAISFSIFSVFDYLWHHFEFATFQNLFRFYAFFVAILALLAFFIYPDEPFEEMGDDYLGYDTPEDYEMEVGEETELIGNVSASPKTVIKQVASLTTIHEHHRHDPHHIESVVAGPSLVIQQPLTSYLRAYERSDSFMISRDVMETDDPNKELMISLKDQPFFRQLFSGSYFRSSLFFWTCTFATNFYVSSISKELADIDQYSYKVQHELAQTFTFFMSSGVMASILVGFLIDRFGVEICTSMTLVFGQIQMVILLFFGENHTMMVASFLFYTLFRSFLYPVFIASLTSRLGFKYFGVLLGLGFFVSGLCQLLMAPLNDAVQGNCHLKASPNPSGDDDCFQGLWISLHLLQLSFLFGLMVIPFMDHRAKVAREFAIMQFQEQHRNDPGLGLSYES